MIVKNGDIVTIRYRIVFPNNDCSPEHLEYEVFTLRIGDEEELPRSVSKKLIGLKAGQNISVNIKADEMVFGRYDDEKIQIIKREEFPALKEPILGMLIDFDIPDRRSITGQIVGISEEGLSIDFNHPLCCRDCVYEMEILSIGS